MAEWLTFEGLEQLDEDLVFAGCANGNRGANLKNEGGLNILGLQIVEPKTLYAVICYLKKGKPCGSDCPKGISDADLKAFFAKAKK